MSNEVLIPIADTEGLGLGVGRRTIGRRIKDPESGFPQAVNINGRLYVTGSALAEYKAQLIRAAVSRPSDKTAPAGNESEPA